MTNKPRSKDSSEGEKTRVLTGDTYHRHQKEVDDFPPSLVILMGPKGYVGRQWLLNKPEMIIGRSVNSDIFVDDPSVSRSHAKLEISSKAEASLVDLGSSNKTIINTKPLLEARAYNLKNNDQIKMGNIIFKFMAKGFASASSMDIYAQAQRDALTGIYNRMALNTRAPEAMKRAEFLGEPLSIILFDIDDFKQLNDTFGHDMGDHVLREMASLVQNRLLRMQQDFFVRYGGEEFMILLSDTNLHKAIEVGERLRNKIENYVFHESGEKKIRTTVSLGVVERNPKETWDVLVKRCDDALYLAKTQGRNRVCTT